MNLEYLVPSSKVLLELGLVGSVLLAPLFFMDKEQNDEEVMKKLFINTGLTFDDDKVPSLINHEEYAHHKMFIYKIPIGMSKRDFIKKKQAIEHQLGGKVKIWNKGNRLFIKIITSKLDNLIPYNGDELQPHLKDCKLGAIIGYGNGNKIIVNDFSSSGCHLFVGGPTDMGKSSGLRSIIISMAQRYTPQYLKFIFIDLKKLELPLLEGLSHVEDTAVTYEESYEVLKGLCKEIDRRQVIISETGKTKIYETDLDLPRLVCVIDEVAEFNGDDDIMRLIDKIGRLGRASGIHMITATQRPTVDVLPGNIKNNFVARIAFACPTAIDSKTILGNGMAADIYDDSIDDEDNLPKGRAIFKRGSIFKEIQMPWIAPKDLNTYIQDINRGCNNKVEKIPTGEYKGEVI